MDRESFMGMAGLGNMEGTFTPPSIGKNQMVRDGNRSWIASLRRANFHSANELRALYPEHVSEADVIVPISKDGEDGTRFVSMDPQEGYKAIVGDKSKKVYSIRSKKYQPVQHADMLDAFTQASEEAGIPVFGKMSDVGGRMVVSAFFADPDCNIQLGTNVGRNSDPYMLGVRAWNSHTGMTGFGVKMQGVRWLCSNMCAFGETLGKASWSHMQKQEELTFGIKNVITSYMDMVPVLRDKMTAMANEELTLDEAECALWGISVTPYKVDAVMENIDELELGSVSNGKVSLYSLYNAMNAYTTYANSGGSDWYKSSELDKTEKLMVGNISRIIDVGAERRTAWEKKVNLEGAVVVGD